MRGVDLVEILNSGSNLNSSAGCKSNKTQVLLWRYFSLFLHFCFYTLLFCCFTIPAFANFKPISHIEVSGLYSISEKELLYLLNIDIGKPIDRNLLRAGIKRAFLKEIFDDIIIDASEGCWRIDEECRVKIRVKEKRVISSIKISGNEFFSDRFIKKHLAINKGDRVNMLAIRDAIEGLKSEMKKRGFVNSNAAFEILPAEKDRVDIIVRITEGEPAIIKKVIISGEDDDVISNLRLSEGDIFDQTEMERLSSKVINHYKKQGFIATRLSYSFDNGELKIEFDRGKKLDIVFEGNKIVSSSDLKKLAPFYEVNEFNTDLVEETTARILSLYHTRGYPFAQIATTITSNDEGISLEFFIFEGERFNVKSILLENATVSHDTIKEIISLKEGGYYNPDILDADTETIVEFYQSLGYIYAEVKEPEIIIQDNMVSVKFSIKEGPLVRLAKISITNIKSFSEEELLREIPLRIGNPYNEVDISDARRKIIEFYNKKGFAETSVEIERFIYDSSADVIFNINEGEVIFFGKSIIIGNEQTKPAVIQRELVHNENDFFDYTLLLQERQRLHKLGLFTDIDVRALETEGRRKDILYKLNEANAGVVEFGLGFGEYERFRGFIDISYKNLWGMHRQASFRTEFSTLEKRVILSYFDPWFIDRKIAFKTVLLHEDRKEKSLDTGDIRYRLKRDSASIGIERKISDVMKAEIYYDFSVVKTFDVKPDVILSKEDIGALIISGIRPGLIYDTRDNPFEPKEGILAGLSVKLASDIFLSETDFIKLTLYANRYQSLSKRIVLALSLRGGIAEGLKKTKELPIVERFFLGGRTTVRGYEQDTLGPKGFDGTPTGGNAFLMGNLEFRTDVGKGFGIVGFLDAGNVWKNIRDVDIKDIKFTTGLGLRYTTPVGPFRIDYGYKLNRERDESSSEIHFSLGHAF